MTNTKQRKWRVTRRGFLTSMGVTGGAIAVGVAFGRAPFYRMLASDPASSDPPPGSTPPSTPDAWFEITPDNRVRVLLAKVEMGQGTHTALAQIAADELNASWDQIDVIQATTNNGPGDALGTQASASITASWLPLREAAASLREMLKLAVAARLNVDAKVLATTSGTVHIFDDPDTVLTYGEVVSLTDTWPEPPADIKLQAKRNYKMIGRSQPRVDLPAKVRGKAIYGYDMRVEGMLYGSVVQPPHIGAQMQAADAGDAQTQAGVVQVVIDRRNNFAGVVAKTRTQARRAANRLNITWSEPEAIDNDSIMAMLDTSGRGYQMQTIGNAARSIGDTPTLEAEYTTPLAVHATMEPLAALADVRADGATVWTSTQFPEGTRAEVATALGLGQESVEIVPLYVGGGFGRKLVVEPTVEAALLSRAVGKPVHVGWTRTMNMQQGFYRPPTRNRIRAKLNGKRIDAVDFTHASGETLFPLLPRAVRTLLGVDSGSYTGSLSFYDNIANRQQTSNIVQLPIRTGLWRGLGLLSNTFASECFMDELAHAAGVDPLQFRLDHLGNSALNQRMATVLQTVANSAEWQTPAPAGRARGIAGCADAGTCMAMIAEVSLDEQGIRVHRITAAVDAGLIINPDGALAQIQGNVMMGTSTALLETIDVANGAVKTRNFNTYPMLTIDRAPEIAIELVESGNDPRGIGEYILGPVAAAIGNALFALTGQRQRSLPLTA